MTHHNISRRAMLAGTAATRAGVSGLPAARR